MTRDAMAQRENAAMNTPAKRSPDGFVAQRLFADHESPPKGPRGPWILTYLNPGGDLAVQLFTDEEVADWPSLD